MLFKEKGLVLYEKVLTIPSTERIPALINQPDGFARVSTALAASLKSAMDNINLRVGLTEDQIIEISCLIIEQSSEDNLSLEDVLLFLQELLLGKMGKIYDRLDVPTFFELFETYRQSRHMALIRAREDQHVQNKALTGRDRSSEELDHNERGLFRSAMNDYLRQTFKNEPENTSAEGYNENLA